MVSIKDLGLDMGPAAILELTFLPKLLQELPTNFVKGVLMGGAREDMMINHTTCGWDLSVLQILPQENDQGGDDNQANTSREHAFERLEVIHRYDAIRAHFQSSIGGLQPQIDAIVRGVLDG